MSKIETIFYIGALPFTSMLLALKSDSYHYQTYNHIVQSTLWIQYWIKINVFFYDKQESRI